MPRLIDGLDVDTLTATTQAEIDAFLMSQWRDRGSLGEVGAHSIWLDARPEIAKLHLRRREVFEAAGPQARLVLGIADLYTAIISGWESGVYSGFRDLHRQGLSRTQLLEVVLVARASGWRGLNTVQSAVGALLPDLDDTPGTAAFPPGWTPDPAAFACGLDLTTPELTAADRLGLERWYTETLGYIPRAVIFGSVYQGGLLKAYRASWEAALRTLPRQLMPTLMLRRAVNLGLPDGIREAALLGRAWGVSREWLVTLALYAAEVSPGIDALDVACGVLDDVFTDWSSGR